MLRPVGSWVAMPTPFTKDDAIDYPGFEILINRQIEFGTSELFVLGSAGETTLLTLDEKKQIVKEVIAMTRGKIPVFFNASAMTTEASADFARYCEQEGADGVIFTIPPYVLIPQTSVMEHLDYCMGAVGIPCGIYNNPARLGVNVEPETIAKLVEKHPNFVADKEAMANVRQLVQIKRLCGDALNMLCCDFPKYSIVIPTLALGGNGTANIGGNIIPAEAARYSRPWTDMKIMEECREEYCKWFPLLEMLYALSNPIVIKAALKILGLPGGHLRRPYQEFTGPKYEQLEQMMDEMGVIKKYGKK
ncbi:dihydrodipicolinate synthase family protein [Breznakiella homolactica]|uniref:Dihydrodipicolinate synthase family protein n=1 Tax=Breznakiella homolactica TaxID=2798577 RepID=A0A7T7XPK7_9SPIR|nr:dihydrodipicolinate synthase family protein [Breznakiella homolactica]QQO10136.1 dihydrodipicolinate synthase family protein [Breznakiella homolactica]